MLLNPRFSRQRQLMCISAYRAAANVVNVAGTQKVLVALFYQVNADDIIAEIIYWRELTIFKRLCTHPSKYRTHHRQLLDK